MLVCLCLPRPATVEAQKLHGCRVGAVRAVTAPLLLHPRPHLCLPQAPITFTAKHWSADVFEDGSCVKTKPVGKQQGMEEKVLWSAGEHMRFESVEAFLAALKAGALNALFGPEAAAQMAQQAAAVAAAAAAARSMPAPATAAAAAVPTAIKPISLESLLQSAGWEVKMNKAAPTDDAPPAPGT